MDKTNYITEGYRQLNNDNHYEKVNEPIYPRTAIQITGILNKLKSSGAISEEKTKQFRFLSPPQDPRPRHFYRLTNRPIMSDCNSESKNVSSFIDSQLKRFAMDHPSYIKNTYDFVEKIKALTLPDNCLLLTLYVESMYTNIDQIKGLQVVRDVMGKYPISAGTPVTSYRTLPSLIPDFATTLGN